VGRKRLDGNEIHLVDVDGSFSVDAGVTGPQRQLARSRVDDPSVLVVGLTATAVAMSSTSMPPRSTIPDAAQVDHPLRVEPGLESWKGRAHGVAAEGHLQR